MLMASICCVNLPGIASADSGDDEALKLAQQKFADVFVEKGDVTVTRYTHVIPFDHPADWSLLQYKEVSSEVHPGKLSEVDKMNGVTWRGSVTFKARFTRTLMGILYPDHEAFDGLHPGDWGQAGNIFGVALEQRSGKWTVKSDDGFSELSKPTATDLQEMSKPLSQEPVKNTAAPTPPPNPDVVAATALAAQRFNELYVKKGDSYFTKHTTINSAGQPAEWAIWQYKNVKFSASAHALYPDDEANGITWRGAVRYDADSLRRIDGPVAPAGGKIIHFPGDDMGSGSDFFGVKVVKQNGQLVADKPSSSIYEKFSKPTESDFHQIEAALQKNASSSNNH